MIGLVALLVSLGAASFSGLQWGEARESRILALNAQAPYLEIVKAAFVSRSSLMLTVRNVGRTPALHPKGENDVFIGMPVQPSSAFTMMPRGIGNPSTLLQDIPVNEDAQVGSYLPTGAMLKQYANYDSGMEIQLRGRVIYSDDQGLVHQMPYCYNVYGAWGDEDLPHVGVCFTILDPDLYKTSK